MVGPLVIAFLAGAVVSMLIAERIVRHMKNSKCKNGCNCSCRSEKYS